MMQFAGPDAASGAAFFLAWPTGRHTVEVAQAGDAGTRAVFDAAANRFHLQYRVLLHKVGSSLPLMLLCRPPVGMFWSLRLIGVPCPRLTYRACSMLCCIICCHLLLCAVSLH